MSITLDSGGVGRRRRRTGATLALSLHGGEPPCQDARLTPSNALAGRLRHQRSKTGCDGCEAAAPRLGAASPRGSTSTREHLSVKRGSLASRFDSGRGGVCGVRESRRDHKGVDAVREGDDTLGRRERLRGQRSGHRFRRLAGLRWLQLGREANARTAGQQPAQHDAPHRTDPRTLAQ